MMYIYRRKNQVLDAFLENHFWIKVRVTDGTTEGGDYVVRLFDQLFTVADPNPAANSSVAIAASFITLINAAPMAEYRVTAYASPDTDSFLVRFDQFGEIPVDIYNQRFGYEAMTTDPNGTIRADEIRPSSYTIENAANWDAVFAPIEEVPYLKGKVTGIDQNAHVINANQMKNRTRFLFNPVAYSLEDGDVLFFTVNTNIDGEDDILDDPPIQIVMSPQQYRDQLPKLILTGEAPQGADYSESLRLQLPRQTSSFTIFNRDSTNTLFVSFGTGSAEISIPPGQSIVGRKVSLGYVNIRGAGGTADVEMLLTMRPEWSSYS